MRGVVEALYVTSRGSAPMERVDEVTALEQKGLKGDRYAEGTGYYSPYDVCEVTLIRAEDLEQIQRDTGIGVTDGEHRRNIVVRDVSFADLEGEQFRVGEAVLRYDGPRPPCRHVEAVTERGMLKALVGRSGICARVLRGGSIRVGDPVVLAEREPARS